jgi:transcriptional regulator with XRE-family HTH domain
MSRQFSRETALGRLMAGDGWTAMEVSMASGVHPRTLSDYLNSRREIQVHHLTALAEVLGCDEEDLVNTAEDVERQRAARWD